MRHHTHEDDEKVANFTPRWRDKLPVVSSERNHVSCRAYVQHIYWDVHPKWKVMAACRAIILELVRFRNLDLFRFSG